MATIEHKRTTVSCEYFKLKYVQVNKDDIQTFSDKLVCVRDGTILDIMLCYVCCMYVSIVSLCDSIFVIMIITTVFTGIC